jgi:hypothetical protein
MMNGIKEIAESISSELKRRLPKQRKTQRTKLALRGGFHNSLATRRATRKMHVAWSSDWIMKPRRS